MKPIDAIDAAVEEEKTISLYAASKKIQPRAVDGQYSRLRWAAVFLTQIVFYGLPWLEWGQRQAVLFDLGARRFYLFGLVLYPQDFIYLTGLLVIAALSLFLFTAVAGRLWCGYACPQTVYTEIFMWIESKIEGDRKARLRLDESPMSASKFGKKSAKFSIWILVALWTGFTFVGYFTAIRTLAPAIAGNLLGPWETFWILFYSFATLGFAGYMREQVCKYMCPYARFQSAMFDKDTLIVTYDVARGEPRGVRSKKATDADKALGDCIDCNLCVFVCPTGIDIRKGLQYECIGCGACADVCDTVMTKQKLPLGLVRYTTQTAVDTKLSKADTIKRVFRPRILVYGSILMALTIALFVSLAMRTPLRVDVVRDRAALSRMVEGGQLENVFRLQIMNATELTQEYRISAIGMEGLKMASEEVVSVGPAESRWVPVRLRIPHGAPSGSHPIHFEISDAQGKAKVSEKAAFLVPR